MLLAIWHGLGTIHRVCTFVISDWRTCIVGDGRPDDSNYIEDFIYDLRQLDFFNREEARQVFDQIGELSVGPLRTARSGSCQLLDLPTATREMLERCVGVTSLDDPAFFELFNELTGGDLEEKSE